MKKAVIIGFGRFGELLARLGAATFDITIIEDNAEKATVAQDQGYEVGSLDAVMDADFIFLAVPISAINTTLIALAPLVHAKHVVIDLCSVKVYPVDLMKKHLPNAQIVGTHPMFGPDSAKAGLEGLRVAVCPIRVDQENVDILTEFWTQQGTTVTLTTPEEHDKDVVYSQAFTYTLAKIILNMNLPDVTFKTRSFNAITEVSRLSANDTPQLFHDMLLYNPYFLEMKAELEVAMTKTDATLSEIQDELPISH